MPSTTPLLFLLDGVLSQEAARVHEAMDRIRLLFGGTFPMSVNPDTLMQSALNLKKVVQLLLESQPALASIPSQNDSSLPLHFAASLGYVPLARLLLSVFPQAALTPNSKGKLALHYAAREGRSQMVTFLLQYDPSTARIPTKKQKLALHFAAGEGHTSIVRQLLQVYPKGAKLPSAKGKLPLHFAARWGHMQVARDLLNVFPQAVSTLDWEGSLPLHGAARQGQFEMSKWLIRLYPKGLQTVNIRNEIPLFPAVQSTQRELAIFMIQVWPEGSNAILKSLGPHDNVHRWDRAILELLLRGAVRNIPPETNGSSGFTQAPQRRPLVLPPPVHGSKKRLRTTEATTNQDNEMELKAVFLPPSSTGRGHLSMERQTMTASAVPGLEITVPRSKSPILTCERARKKRASRDSTRHDDNTIDDEENSLTKKSPPLAAAVLHPFIPLHAAFACGASSFVLQLLLDRYPEQVRVADGNGQLPLHIGAANIGTGRREQAAKGATSKATATPFCLKGFSENDEHLAQTAVVLRLLGAFPEAASIRDKQGRLPLHIALESRADFALVHALLQSNPSSGFKHCETCNPRFAKRLPLLMATVFDCELSTTYELLRGDPSTITTLLHEDKKAASAFR